LWTWRWRFWQWVQHSPTLREVSFCCQQSEDTHTP
jgi:hypothetical protein